MAETTTPTEPTRMSEAKERVKQKRAAKVAEKVFTTGFDQISIDSIEEERNPRVLASEPEQKALNASVKQHGVLQPIRVRPADASGTKFFIIAGHRRLLAAKTAKLPTIPAVVTTADSTQAFVESLVENLQREDLNPLDEAKALKTLMEETGQTQEELGKRLGKTQSAISNSMRLLTLAEPVQQAIEDGQLSASHGKALAGLPEDQQKVVARDAIENKMPSRKVEERIATAKDETRRKNEAQQRRDAQVAAMLETLKGKRFGLKNEDVMILVGGYGNAHLVEAAQKAGYTSRPSQSGDREMGEKPDYECDEQKSTFTYNEYRGTLVPTCTDKSHYEAFVKERDAEKIERQKLATKKISQAKNATMKALRSDDGKGLLNVDGQRLALYQLLMSSRGYSSTAQYEAFVKRHGGPANGAAKVLAMDVIEAIENLSEEDLGKELAAAAVSGLFPNVWGENASPYSVQDDWPVRAMLVEKIGLDKDIVWGNVEPPLQTLMARSERGQTLTKAEQKRLEK